MSNFLRPLRGLSPTPFGAGSRFPQGQGQFRKLAELDSRQAARQGEPAGLRVSQIKGLRGGVLLGTPHKKSRRLTQRSREKAIYGWKLA